MRQCTWFLRVMVLVIVFYSFSMNDLHAGSVYWTGGTSSTWDASSTGNWSTSSVPSSTDDVYFNNSTYTQNVTTLSGARTAAGLTFNSNVTSALTVTGTAMDQLQLFGQSDGSTGLTVDSGSAAAPTFACAVAGQAYDMTFANNNANTVNFNTSLISASGKSITFKGVGGFKVAPTASSGATSGATSDSYWNVGTTSEAGTLEAATPSGSGYGVSFNGNVSAGTYAGLNVRNGAVNVNSTKSLFFGSNSRLKIGDGGASAAVNLNAGSILLYGNDTSASANCRAYVGYSSAGSLTVSGGSLEVIGAPYDSALVVGYGGNGVLNVNGGLVKSNATAAGTGFIILENPRLCRGTGRI